MWLYKSASGLLKSSLDQFFNILLLLYNEHYSVFWRIKMMQPLQLKKNITFARYYCETNYYEYFLSGCGKYMCLVYFYFNVSVVKYACMISYFLTVFSRKVTSVLDLCFTVFCSAVRLEHVRNVRMTCKNHHQRHFMRPKVIYTGLVSTRTDEH